MNKLLTVLVSISVLSIYGCSKFLDQVPENDIETINTIFEVRSSALNFHNTCHVAAYTEFQFGDFDYDPAMLCGGEYVAGDRSRTGSIGSGLKETLSISDGLQNTNTPYVNLWKIAVESDKATGSVYAAIRYCNIFIENIDKVNNMPIWERRAWKAEIKCIKAFYYFELMKRYGPIVLVPENIDSNADIIEMQTPRSNVDTCFNEIVRLFDEAIPDLRTRKELPADMHGTFTLEAAYAYKARVLLYAASPLFNGNIDYSQFKNKVGEHLFSVKYDHEKWKRAAEAIDDAIEIVETNKMKLVQGTKTEMTNKLNQIRDIQYSTAYEHFDLAGEWIYMRTVKNLNGYSIMPRFKTNHTLHASNGGCVSPNIQTVELFYTDNGLPISKDRTWNYSNRYKMGSESNIEYKDIIELKEDVLNLHLRREPRFYANIAASGTYSTYGNKNYLVEPMRGESMGTEHTIFNDRDIQQNLTGYWSKKGTLPKDTPQSHMSGRYVVLMRLADLYLMQAEAWNEYSGPSDKVYDAIDKVRNRAGILPIRQAWSQYSNSPEDVKNKESLRDIIHQERMIEFVFEGHHFYDLKRWKKAENVLNKPHLGWNIMGETKVEFYNNFNQPMIVWDKVKFVAPRDYFWPIKSEEVMIADIVQNPGW